MTVYASQYDIALEQGAGYGLLITVEAPPGSPRDLTGYTAEMVIRELPGGGAVFNVGSITYVASLLVDAGTSRVTRNVLERFIRPGVA